MRKIISALTLLFSLNLLHAQSLFSEEYAFITHLESIEAYEESLIYLTDLGFEFNTQGTRDTIAFFKGKAHYQLRNRMQSIQDFEQVSRLNLNYWNASKFYSALQYAYLNDVESAKTSFIKAELTAPVELALLQFELASLALLNGDLSDFENRATHFDNQFFQLVDHQKELMGVYQNMKSRKRKSPFLAGLFSAIVPGSGKMYAGLVAQGIMSLMTSTIFGLQTYEVYRKNGPNSAPFYLFGTAFSVFYVANIWGSVTAVQKNQQDFNDINNETIMLHMHIPIRLLYY